MTGLWVLLLTSLAGGVVWHVCCRRFGWAVVGATVSSALAFQLLAWWQLGHLDPLAVVALLVSLPVAALMAVLAGWVVDRLRPEVSDV